MTTMTKQVIQLLTDKPMTAIELRTALGGESFKGAIHCILNTLKKRDALIVVGKRVDEGARRANLVYRVNTEVNPLKNTDHNKSRHRADLLKAKNVTQYKEMLLRKNYMFMLYAKELKLEYK